MESQPQNHEFRINPENFHPCITGETIHMPLFRCSFHLFLAIVINIK